MPIKNKIKILLGVLLLFGAFLPVFEARAATEFITTIKQSGGNFSTLSSWESTLSAGTGLDLTSSITKVFSHSGITGSISASSTVTGLTSGATGLAVYTTSSQMLIKNIVGTFQSGEQARVDASNYVTLSNVGDSVIAVAQIDGAWTSADTTGVTIGGWTTGSNNYIKIYTTTEARHSGKWDTTKYRIEPSSGGNVLYITEENVRIDGLQISKQNDAYDTGAIQIRGTTGVVDARISNSIIKGNGAFTVNNWQYGIATYSNPGGGVVRIWNNIVYDIAGSGAAIYSFLANNSGMTHYVYNNTVYNSKVAYSATNGTVVAKNNVAQSSTDGFSGTFNASSNYNISDLASDAPGANSKNATTVSFSDTANKDFHLSSSDTSAKDSGTDLSADTYHAFSTDIDGETRSGTWDIGADEMTASASALHGGDRNPPQISSVLAKEITKDSAVIIWQTDEYSHSEVNYGDTAYIYNNTVVDWDKSLSHSVKLVNLSSGTTYHFQVRSQDKLGNTATDNNDYTFTTLPNDISQPQISEGLPSGTLPAGARQATLSLSADELSICRYSNIPNTKYSEMGNTFKITGTLLHQTELNDLRDGYIYNYYAKCQDMEGNVNKDDYLISFKIEEAPSVTFQSLQSLQKDTVVDEIVYETASLQQQINELQKLLEQLLAELVIALQAQLQVISQ